MFVKVLVINLPLCYNKSINLCSSTQRNEEKL